MQNPAMPNQRILTIFNYYEKLYKMNTQNLKLLCIKRHYPDVEKKTYRINNYKLKEKNKYPQTHNILLNK